MERYNTTILAMLRNYVNEHQSDWDEYAIALTYAYNNHVHRSTGTTPFDLVLSSSPPAFSLYHNSRGVRKATDEQREHYIEQLDATTAKAYDRLLKTQRRYKQDLDERVRTANRNIRSGEYVYLGPTDVTTKGTKLGNHALGTYRVLENDLRTFFIQRDDEVERVNSDSITHAPPTRCITSRTARGHSGRPSGKEHGRTDLPIRSYPGSSDPKQRRNRVSHHVA